VLSNLEYGGTQGVPPGAGSSDPGTAPGQQDPPENGTPPGGREPTAPGTATDLLPSVSAPKGGGAIRGLGEKFAVNAATGTADLTVPIPLSPGRSGFTPALALSYDSGAGNGPLGFGWGLEVPAITRKTDKGLPQYLDAGESDVYILAGAEDLVPVLDSGGGQLKVDRTVFGTAFVMTFYRPRIEGLYSRIERWTAADTGISQWRTISRDNVTTLYGADPGSRVANPANPAQVFSWQISQSWDDKGNAASYSYLAEDSAGIDTSAAHECNRTPAGRAAQVYLKSVSYGNLQPYLPDWTADAAPPLPADWAFTVVLDYGDHGAMPPVPQPDQPWPLRPDPFSAYRARFEVRTYRRVQRLLFFHNFPAEPAAGPDLLVRSLDLVYADQQAPPGPASAVYSLLASVTQCGYRQDPQAGLVTRSLPPLELTYSQPRLGQEILTLDPDSQANLPEGLDDASFRWVDLDGEGLFGILAAGDDGGWYYKRNLSAANLAVQPDGSQIARASFGPARPVAALPSRSDLSGVRLLDLSGSGRLDVVDLAGPDPGYFERDDDGGFAPLQRFAALPALDYASANVTFIDVTGDGLADILMTEDGLYTVHASLCGDAGYDVAVQVRPGWDEERGPSVVLADGSQTIFTADMSGDGLSDIVRVRNGEACYWPNTGYGTFGAKVTMDGAPRFDSEERFDPRRVLLADIDGTGTADLLYAGDAGVTAWFSQSGSSWSAPVVTGVFPSADRLGSLHALDLLGTGTACLVWSSPLPSQAAAPLRYVDLMSGAKPHLLTGAVNNLGAETRVSYAPATQFYVADELAGTPWLTRLPFPVQVVRRTETIDWIGRGRQVCQYAYHHGYFDGYEREFRGFGMVEQTDTEELRDDAVFDDGDALNWDQQSWSPPMLTRTWYHTGAFTQAGAVSQGYAAAFWTEPALRAPGRQADAAAMLLPDTVLPDALDAQEAQEAYRALKGHALRTEVYALDGSAQQDNPYTVTEQNYTLTLVQAMGVNPHAVLAVAPRESVTFRYDRGLDDPQAGHELVLDTDEYGNVLRKVTAGYPRRAGYPPPEPSLSTQVQQALAYDQGRLHVTGAQYGYTNAIDDLASWPDAYRVPLPAATDTAELTGTAPSAKGTGITSRFSFDEIDGTGGVWDTTWTTAADIPYEAIPGSDVDGTGSPAAAPTRRFTAQSRTVYRGDDLTALLPPGQLQPLALTGESYQAALTAGLLTAIFGAVLAGPALTTALAEGGYVQLAGETPWWRPSGRVYYSPGDTDTPAQELTYASAGFFLPCRAVDPFGGISRASYDGYRLLTASVTDQVGNVTSAASDYRVLAPATVTDPNGNRAACAYDALGLVTATAAMGKTTESLGDLLAGFTIDLDSTTLLAQFADPLAGPAAVLGSATSRSLYDVGAYQRTAGTAQPEPPAAYTLSRQLRVSDLASPPYPGAPTTTGYTFAFAYSDGLGRVIQKKAQAAPGPVTDGGPTVSPRWAGSGWTIYDNKQRPVKVFEPFFSATNGFEFAAAAGVATVTFYDPPGRVAARLYPDSSWDKTVFGPWLEQRWDRDDTVLITDPRTDPDVGGYFSRVLPAGPFSTWYELRIGGGYGATAADQAAWLVAAQQAAKAGGTPATALADSLGRPCLTVADNGGGELYPTRTARDTQGTTLAITDPLGRRATEFVLRQAVATQPYLAGTDMAGAQLYHVSADGGARRGLPAVTGAMIRSYDARGHAIRLSYDAARRPVARYVATGGGPEALIELSVYGEGQQAANLCGREFRHYDPSGYLENSAFDYAGNLTATRRQLAAGYRATPDWTPLAGLTAAAALDAAAATAGLIPAGGQDAFAGSTSYDALSRPVQLVMPHNTAMLPDVLQPGYDEASLLTTMDAWLQRAAAPAALLNPVTATMRTVTGIEYNARGQRACIGYGNGTVSAYAYDPQTFRLAQLTTTRPATLPAGQRVVQALAYFYDPVGNITTIADSADTQDVIFFNNQRVDPTASYGYDPLYRLTSATGREHLGQTGTALAPPRQVTSDDSTRMGLPQPGDGNAMGNYTESYTYDAAGNLLTMGHMVSSGNWTRRYSYAEPSQIDPAATGSRLSASSLPGDPAAGPYSARYSHDAHGNMTSMPQLAVMTWDADDRLLATARQAATSGTAQTTYYSCAGHGQRIRKVTVGQAAAGQQATRKAERIYLGGIEVYREYATDGVTVTLERQTLRIADGARPVALVETRTSGTDKAAQQQVRYQHGNHLDSAALELDDTAQIISYEEYFPFGATAYQAVSAQVDVPKRYRFTGKERDEENDLYYHGARYYAPWLGRWTACDPVTSPAGLTPYSYAASNPVRLTDPSGRDPVPGHDPPSGQDRDEGVGGDMIGQPGTPGSRYFPHLPALRLTLSPANFWYSSMSQGSGIMDPGSIDVEAGALGMAGRTTGLNLRNPVGSGGLATGVVAVRQQVPNVPGLDIGVAGTGSYVAQGQSSVTPAGSTTPTTAPGTAQDSGAALVTAHYGAQHVGGVDWLSAAGYVTAGYQHSGQTGQPDIDAGTVQFLGAVGYEHDPPGPPEHFRLSDPPTNPNPLFLSALMLNPVISYTSGGSLSQGPPLTNMFGVGGIGSVGVGFGRSFGVTAEGSVTHTWGSAVSGSDQAANSTAERIGLIGTYNYADRSTDGPQTSSISVGVWYGHESGTITGTATPTAPTGNWDTNSIFFGVIFGYRRSPH
jgi:RHS repeat-associated protein